MTIAADAVLSHMINRISNKSLLPKPHLSVINVKAKDPKASGLFTSSDKPSIPNLIGYDVIVSGKTTQALSKTIFECFIRAGLVQSPESQNNHQGFRKFHVEMTTILANGTSRINIKIDGDQIVDQEMQQVKDISGKRFFEHKFQENYPINFLDKNGEQVSEKNPISILFKKNWENTGGSDYKIQVEIKNISLFQQLQIYVHEKECLANNSVDLGLLMEHSTYEICEAACFKSQINKRGSSTAVKRLLNVVAQNETESSIQFKDYYIGKEVVPRFRKGAKISDFVRKTNECEQRLHHLLGKAFESMWGADGSFYKYQEEGIRDILREFETKSGQINIVSARTAGGKTETFSVPLLNFCLKTIDKRYTKALVFYPTKALANDQAGRIFRIVYLINKFLKEGGDNRKITMGIYHGDTKTKATDEKSVWIPFKCPECDTLVKEKTEHINHFLYCPTCNITFDFLFLTKYQIHQSTPDILITNQDTLTLRLMESPESHSIFGRSILYCENCGSSNINGRSCCNRPLKKVSPQGVPEVIIFDEIHMLKGAFGMNTALFLNRLETILRVYSKNDRFKPIYIGASATINKPEEFAKKLFHTSNINIIPKGGYSDIYEEQNDSNIRREHLFILPTVFSSAETTAFGVSYILEYFRSNLQGQKPRILGFNNSLKDCRDLINRTHARSSGFKIDGHTAQFDNDSRAKTERDFSKGEIDVLFATSTLEVGVDFDEINVLILHGAPSSFNDFLQRVGRSGRRTDAAVITSLRNWNPIDYYYFENCRTLLEKPMSHLEEPPINEHNGVLLKNHAKCAFFDFLSSGKAPTAINTVNDLKKYLTDDKVQNTFDPAIRVTIKGFIMKSFPNDGQLIDEALNEIEKRIFGALGPKIQFFDQLINEFKVKEQIHHLRISDKQIEVDYII